VAELREDKSDRVLTALLSGAGKTREDALGARKSAKFAYDRARQRQTPGSLNGHGPPDHGINLIRGNM
jgi:hypothetical protein